MLKLKFNKVEASTPNFSINPILYGWVYVVAVV